MIPVAIRRVFIAQHRVDFRKQISGLLAEAYRVSADPYRGDCVVFLKADQTQIRVLVGDQLGLYLVSRRFDGGRLRWLASFASDPSIKSITTGELSLLLEGTTFTVHKRARPCSARLSPLAA
jgi:hypothetical protein